MNSNMIAKGVYKAIILLIATFLLCYVIYLIRSVIAYLSVAVILALIGRPAVVLMRERLKFPKILAVALTILLLFAVLIGLVWLFVPLFTEQGEKLALLDMKNIQLELELFFKEITNFFGGANGVVAEMVDNVDIEETVKEELDSGFFPHLFNSLMDIISTMGIGLFSIIFIAFFLLKDTKTIQATLVGMFSSKHRLGIMSSIDTIKNLLSRYFIGLLLQIFVLFIIYLITLSAVGIEHPFAIAFLCALFNIIPYVGPLIGAILMLVFTVTSNLGMDFSDAIVPKLGCVAIGIVIGQLIDNFFSQPFIFSNSVKSHPLEIFLIITVFGLLFGVIGMIIAVPCYTVLKVVLREFFPNNNIVKALTTQL